MAIGLATDATKMAAVMQSVGLGEAATDQGRGYAAMDMLRAVSDHGISADAPIDMAHLRRYTLGDRGLEKEVLDLFLQQLPFIISALGGSEPSDVRSRAAHTLKGSGRAVGAWRIAALAEDIERLMQVNRTAGVQPLVDQIEAAVGDVRGFVRDTYAVSG